MNNASRYSKGTSAWVEHPVEGRVQVVHLPPLRWTNYPYTRYQPSSADTLPSIAFRSYGRSQDYWFVAAMNPQIECPDDIVAGDLLYVPTSKIW